MQKKTIFELFLKEAIKTAERVKIASFTSPLPPSTERVKNKRMKYQSALFRQVHEAVRLHRKSQNPEVKILNSKAEYNRCKLPRVQVADESKDPKEYSGGRVKYSLPNKQLKAIPNDNKEIKERSDRNICHKTRNKYVTIQIQR